MYGRTRLSTDYSETRIKLKFDADYPAPNIAGIMERLPDRSDAGAVRSQDGKRVPQQMPWGLVPWWAKDIKVGFSSINARAETVDTAPAFRDTCKKGQRCLVMTGERIKSCTIITCPANALVGALHDRMPVILAEEKWAKWLGEDPATNDELKVLLVPFKDDALTMWPVNRQKIGNVRNKARDVALPEPVSSAGAG
jgi:putative SOS response-associated peptidase YedK